MKMIKENNEHKKLIKKFLKLVGITVGLGILALPKFYSADYSPRYEDVNKDGIEDRITESLFPFLKPKIEYGTKVTGKLYYVKNGKEYVRETSSIIYRSKDD